MSARNYQAEMKLPQGKTCADCQNGPRCDALIGCVRKGFTSCDWWPSRYVAVTPPTDQHYRKGEAA